jgi:hypothetical protein
MIGGPFRSAGKNLPQKFPQDSRLVFPAICQGAAAAFPGGEKPLSQADYL